MKLKEKRDSLIKEVEEARKILKAHFKEELKNYEFTIPTQQELLEYGKIRIYVDFSGLSCREEEISCAYCRIKDLIPFNRVKELFISIWQEAANEIFEDGEITYTSHDNSSVTFYIEIKE